MATKKINYPDKRKRGAGLHKRTASIVKQKKVLAGVLRGESITKAAKDVGYTEKYIRSGGITRSKTWKELVKTGIDDEELIKQHNRLLQKKEVFSTKQGLVWTEQAHTDVAKALDLAYKLKNRYGDTTIHHKFEDESDEQLVARRIALATRIVRSRLRIDKTEGKQ